MADSLSMGAMSSVTHPIGQQKCCYEYLRLQNRLFVRRNVPDHLSMSIQYHRKPSPYDLISSQLKCPVYIMTVWRTKADVNRV